MPLGQMTAQQADQHVRDFQRRTNSRAEAHIPDSIRQHSLDNQFYIYSVGPWPQKRFMGTMGRCTIPACKDGQRFTDPIVVPGTPVEQYPMNESQMTAILYDGERHANEIIGIGPSRGPEESLHRYGVFVSRHNPPLEEEIELANKRLDTYCDQLIYEGGQAHADGPLAVRQTIRPERHGWAANRRKKTHAECPWMGGMNTAQQDRVECPFCSVAISAKVAKCHNCHEVVNQEAYKAAQKMARQVSEPLAS